MKKAFTLIELLVVIAIIALLLSILMPALRKAKAIARNVVCMSNMKQQNLIFSLYTQDNDGKYPTRASGWPHWIYVNGSAEQAWSAMLPYVDDPDITICPALASYKMDLGDVLKDSDAIHVYPASTTRWGGWASENPTIVVLGYTWFFNYEPSVGATYEPGTSPWPNHQTDANSSGALAAHLLVLGSVYPEDWGHEASSGGRGTPTGSAPIISDLTSKNAPVLYGDGSVISVPKNRMRRRAQVGGSIFVY